MKVKICGNTNQEDVRLALSLGADYIGLIFTESKRKVTLATAKEIVSAFPKFKSFVGVFSNQPKQEVESTAAELRLTFLQFHGDETALYCSHFRTAGFQVIKTFHVRDAMSFKRIDEYDVDYFLLDTYSSSERGGSGVPFDWHLLDERPVVQEKMFLAGGLNSQNVVQAIEKVRPYAVDVASGVEQSPGKKSPELLKQFIQLAKGIPHHA